MLPQLHRSMPSSAFGETPSAGGQIFSTRSQSRGTEQKATQAPALRDWAGLFSVHLSQRCRESWYSPGQPSQDVVATVKGPPLQALRTLLGRRGIPRGGASAGVGGVRLPGRFVESFFWQTAKVQILAPHCPDCAASGKSLNISEPLLLSSSAKCPQQQKAPHRWWQGLEAWQ